MLQAYSENISVTTNENIKFNSISLQTGCTATIAGGSNIINLNRPGIYHIEFNASGTTTDAGTIGAQLQSNGTNVTRAAAAATTTASGTQNIAFSTLISVGNCPCNGHKSLNIVYTGSAGTLTIANVIVTKIR